MFAFKCYFRGWGITGYCIKVFHNDSIEMSASYNISYPVNNYTELKVL